MGSFEKLGLSQDTLGVLKRKGFEEPTPIQEKAIPAVLLGKKDIVGQAQTGTGKTAAFGLPIIELLKEKSKAVQAIVLAPTRELAIQVAEEMHSLKGKKKLSIIPIYGGQSIDLQLRRLRKGVDIVVGTPGRVLDHLKRRTLKLDQISFMVLDEADEMLNMGFFEDVKAIMDQTSQDKRVMLFSATMPNEIMQISKKYMKDYEILKVVSDQLTGSRTDQLYFEVAAQDKFESLCRIIDIEDNFYGLVFCRTKIDVDKVANHLMERGYDSAALHGDMSQTLRERILNKFKKRQVNILVATDVAARGIDVQDISHVINFALPQDSESYVHRIGRTGRAGKEGVAITFVTPEEYRKLKVITRKVKTDIRKAKLPKVSDIIESKRKKIKTQLGEIVRSDRKQEYTDLAQELLKENDSQEILGALLQHTFQGVLDVSSYALVEEGVVDRKGKTRLFVQQGKDNGLTNAKLVKIIVDKCSITSEKIRDIQIFDRFAFVTLPFHEAETVLSFFKRNRQSGFYITKAKQDRTRTSARTRTRRR